MPTTRIDNVIHDILGTALAYPGCPTLIGGYSLNNQRFGQPTLVFLLDARGTEVSQSPVFSGVDWLKVSNRQAPLAIFPDADGYVDSYELLRCFNVYMSTLNGYQQSQVNSPLIQLTFIQESCFVLPVIPVDNRQGERIYYLIADGNHNWKRVPPKEIEAQTTNDEC